MLGHGPIAGRPLSDNGAAASLAPPDGGFYSLVLPLGAGAPGGAPPPEMVPAPRRAPAALPPPVERRKVALPLPPPTAYLPPTARRTGSVADDMGRPARGQKLAQDAPSAFTPAPGRRAPGLALAYEARATVEAAIEGVVVGDSIPFVPHRPPALALLWTSVGELQIAVEGEAVVAPPGDTIPSVRHTAPALEDAPARARAPRRLTPEETFQSVDASLPGAFEGLTLVEAPKRRQGFTAGAVAAPGDTIRYVAHRAPEFRLAELVRAESALAFEGVDVPPPVGDQIPFVLHRAPELRVDWAVRVDQVATLEGVTVAPGDTLPALRRAAPIVALEPIRPTRVRTLTPVESFLSVDASLPGAFAGIDVWLELRARRFTAVVQGSVAAAPEYVPPTLHNVPRVEVALQARARAPGLLVDAPVAYLPPLARARRIDLPELLTRAPRPEHTPEADRYVPPASRARRIEAPEVFRQPAGGRYTPPSDGYVPPLARSVRRNDPQEIARRPAPSPDVLDGLTYLPPLRRQVRGLVDLRDLRAPSRRNVIPRRGRGGGGRHVDVTAGGRSPGIDASGRVAELDAGTRSVTSDAGGRDVSVPSGGRQPDV